MSLCITEHARQRANERLGWRIRTLDRMLERIFYFGLAPETAPARLARFLAHLQEGAGATVRAYGQHVFIFQHVEEPTDIALVTVYLVPTDLRPLLRKRCFASANTNRFPSPMPTSRLARAAWSARHRRGETASLPIAA